MHYKQLRDLVVTAADWADDRDRELFVVLADFRNRPFDAVFPPLSIGADAAPVWLTIAILLALRPGPRRRAASRGTSTLAVSSVVTNLLLKRITRRPRPPLEKLHPLHEFPVQPRTTSFPSGHAASAAGFVAGAASEYPLLALPLGVLAGAICYSRVYTGAHYPGDVFAGASVGVLFAKTSDLSWIVDGVFTAAGRILRRTR